MLNLQPASPPGYIQNVHTIIISMSHDNQHGEIGHYKEEAHIPQKCNYHKGDNPEAHTHAPFGAEFSVGESDIVSMLDSDTQY